MFEHGLSVEVVKSVNLFIFSMLQVCGVDRDLSHRSAQTLDLFDERFPSQELYSSSHSPYL